MSSPLVQPASADNHQHISAAAVRRLCGNVSDMTLWRWLEDPANAFPKPIYIGRRRYWREAEIVAWLDNRPTSRPPELAAIPAAGARTRSRATA
jgi:predicted DNA-binding transcriptional regulator AlpA